jgi:chemotaxis protein MotB
MVKIHEPLLPSCKGILFDCSSNMRRKQKHEEHDNHERWLVSYADFITLLFAFFVVMYAISSLNEGKYRVLSDSLINAFKNSPTSSQPIQPQHINYKGDAPIRTIPQPIPIRSRTVVPDKQIKQKTENMRSIAQEILKVLAPLVKEGQVKVTQSNRGVSLEINASVLFEPGEAALHGDSIRALTAVAQVLAKLPSPIQVEGYTDDIPINTAAFPSNWELSSARASSVVRLFIENGVLASRLVAIGHAANLPVDGNETPDGRARNRRVTILISSDLPVEEKNIPIVQANPDFTPIDLKPR